MMRVGWQALKKNSAIKKASAGYEQTTRFARETLFWRHVNTRWLIAQFSRHSCSLFRRDGGMFTEMYTYLPGKFFKSAMHAWNLLAARLPRTCPNWPITMFSFSARMERPGFCLAQSEQHFCGLPRASCACIQRARHAISIMHEETVPACPI